MENNIFFADKKPLRFEEYLKYDENSRGNLGEELPVLVYRMLEYSLKDELVQRFGKETQVEIFRSAGRTAGEYFTKHMLGQPSRLKDGYSYQCKRANAGT